MLNLLLVNRKEEDVVASLPLGTLRKDDDDNTMGLMNKKKVLHALHVRFTFSYVSLASST